MASLKHHYNILTILYAVNLIVSVHEYRNGVSHSDWIYWFNLVIPIAISEVVTPIFFIFVINGPEINFALPLIIILAFIYGAIGLESAQRDCIDKIQRFAEKVSYINKYTKWTSKLLCIILLSIAMLCTPFLIILMLSPFEQTAIDSDRNALICYQLFFIIPSIICYTIIIDDTSNYILWIGFIACILYILYFLTETINHHSLRLGEFVNLQILFLDSLKILLFIALSSMLETYYLTLMITIFVISLPIYNAYLWMQYHEWIENSALLQIISKYDGDEMDVLYSAQHNAIYHKHKHDINRRGIIHCMDLHRKWKKLSIQEKHRSLRASIGIKYTLKKLWRIIVMINFLIPIMIFMWQFMIFAHGTSSLKIMVFCGMYTLYLIKIVQDEYDNLVTTWKINDILLIEMSENLTPKNDRCKKQKVQFTLDHVIICDVMEQWLPQQLANIVIEYLTNACHTTRLR